VTRHTRRARAVRIVRSVKGSFYQTSDGYTRDPMIPSPPFRFRTLGDVREHVWWTTLDLNPTQWTPEPYTLWLRFVLEWLMVCGVMCGVCGVLCGVCGVWCVVCCGPCRRAGLVGGWVLLSQAWRQSRRRDRVVALVVGRVLSSTIGCHRRLSSIAITMTCPPRKYRYFTTILWMVAVPFLGSYG
jgi:hypothetical protein